MDNNYLCSSRNCFIIWVSIGNNCVFGLIENKENLNVICILIKLEKR
ncbi:hypothetical protein CLOSPI_00998 [Thomasclavelia spiroformis DSM 1552]|uniref:Uncharacterized protein n=1 Tax=Thomasclavelia spiroformis DSM 1552 TaxID=428126 RepID=B1C1B5_9FIRM|nr:hypothetical protein CLOSPI_00998 [Thomasclavelia spiroformis DSM 1552]